MGWIRGCKGTLFLSTLRESRVASFQEEEKTKKQFSLLRLDFILQEIITGKEGRSFYGSG